MIRIATLLFSIALTGTAQADERFITLSSTTSTQDSGLFGYILPLFQAATGVSVHVVAVGTGQALAIGERGDADALLVHDRPGEDKFVAEGYGIDRRDVMYNDFVIVGPNTDPAHIRGLKDAQKALTQIAAAQAPFASRGDDSGTNRMELRLWRAAGIPVDAQSPS
ncbi:MAG TPA: substrate-binding domain-containing protein, partial [Xanthobacteraceae bacterium]|nr:substrate-binding domain-containing protein [Xanthobacteraceae bacterium]